MVVDTCKPLMYYKSIKESIVAILEVSCITILQLYFRSNKMDLELSSLINTETQPSWHKAKFLRILNFILGSFCIIVAKLRPSNLATRMCKNYRTIAIVQGQSLHLPSLPIYKCFGSYMLISWLILKFHSTNSSIEEFIFCWFFSITKHQQ